MQPYYDLIHSYGWANYFFQTDEGSSWPAHQFIFSGTTAVTADEDHAGNMLPDAPQGGCANPATAPYGVVGPNRRYIGTALPCLSHQTLTDLLEAKQLSWRYYGESNPPGYWPDTTTNGIWMAPNSIDHICGSGKSAGQCRGADYTAHTVFIQSQVLKDISTNCDLANMSWVTPDGEASDHARDVHAVNGPAWVASIVNAVGQSTCKNADGSSYWNSTAIIVTWDDWGGWYDHEIPIIEPYPQGGTQMGFRVPLIVVSAYTHANLISNKRSDFGSVLRFVEHNFRITQGALTFADARSAADLSEFFNLARAPRTFAPIPTAMKAQDFINRYDDPKHKPEPPDDD
jgi:phospholipase C